MHALACLPCADEELESKSKNKLVVNTVGLASWAAALLPDEGPLLNKAYRQEPRASADATTEKV